MRCNTSQRQDVQDDLFQTGIRSRVHLATSGTYRERILQHVKEQEGEEKLLVHLAGKLRGQIHLKAVLAVKKQAASPGTVACVSEPLLPSRL